MNRKVSLILGMFDGVHIGHQALIQKAKEYSPDCEVAVFTFSNTPSAFFGRPVSLLTLPSEKEMLLKKYGAEQLRMQQFDGEIAQMTPEAYVQYLQKQFDIAHIIVGFNHAFGKNGAGNGASLMRMGKQSGFATHIVPPVLHGTSPVSSTRIRTCLSEGRIEDANEMLGYAYFMQGEVVGGRHIGSTLGFPTANIMVDAQKLLPKEGVYITLTEHKGQIYRSITNIGTNPTVSGEGKCTIETHILRFEKDIYHTDITVRFVKRLRDEQHFDNKEALSGQLETDKVFADAYLNQYQNQNIKRRL